MAGIKDVARAAGVSVSTVSYVLSGKRSISAKTTDKVMAAVEKLGYTPDASARKMRGVRNQIIALSAPIRGDINQAKYNAYFLHTAWQAKDSGYDVLLLTGEDAVGDLRRVTQSNLVDGVVLLDIEEHDDRAAEAGSYSKPCVAIGLPSEHGECACVDIDFALAGRQAADCLYSKGHRNVVFLRDNESDYERGSGYVLLFRESLMAHAEELGIRIVESSKHAFNQASANVLNQVLQEMQAVGLSVPGDVSVLSCGTYFEGELMTQPITEMPVMPQELCSKAVGLLVDAIERYVDIKGVVELSKPVMRRRGSVAEVGVG